MNSNAPIFFNGLRMGDVNRQIAVAGRGFDTVEKIDAGRYIATTLDGRKWDVYLNTAGTWTGELAAR